MSEENKGGVYGGIEWLAAWLLDNAEGETITEEQLRPWAIKAYVAHSERKAESCEWTEDDDGIWWACGANCWTFESSGPEENGMEFCPFCAKPLVPVAYIWENDQ